MPHGWALLPSQALVLVCGYRDWYVGTVTGMWVLQLVNGYCEDKGSPVAGESPIVVRGSTVVDYMAIIIMVTFLCIHIKWLLPLTWSICKFGSGEITVRLEKSTLFPDRLPRKRPVLPFNRCTNPLVAFFGYRREREREHYMARRLL